MWLLLSASALPLVFLFYFLVPGTPARWYILLLLAGYSVCFCVQFLFWCMGVFLYHGDSKGGSPNAYRKAFAGMRSRSRPALLPGLVTGVVAVFAFMAAQMLVSMLLSFLLTGGVSAGSVFVLTLVHFYLSYLVADLVMVLLVLVPQMICLEGGTRVEEVFRASYTLIKERYRDAMVLFIVPELVVRTLFLGASFAVYYVPGPGLIFAILLVSMSLLEGGRTAFVAAAFNRLYYRILEEESKKKRKGKDGKGEPGRGERPAKRSGGQAAKSGAKAGKAGSAGAGKPPAGKKRK
ncbi:MAG: hypothetical protein HPY75_06895 [Actinobacteria bacterium]|nr:hypothetical protein [Actinomycetota bacterium]